jgi:DNA-binding GntR family transcriptional regulator
MYGQRALLAPASGDPTVTTKADEIRHQLEELIVAGQLRAGTVLRQDELARRFRVSRTPIREALRQLAAVGLVSFTPNRGVRVRALDRQEWAQTYLARAALEGAATEVAASTMTTEHFDRLALANADFACQTELLRQPTLQPRDRSAASYAWVAANDRFHTEILQAARLPVIENLLIGLRRVFSGEAGWSPGSAADALYEANMRQHAAIHAALVARNGIAARHLMEDHIMDSWRRLQAVLDEASPTATTIDHPSAGAR